MIKKIRTLILIWFCWLIILIGFQAIVTMRTNVIHPDYVLDWCVKETYTNSNESNVYLSNKFMNTHVAWDSQFYLSIAMEGYDSDSIRKINYDDKIYSYNYAFMPLYPMSIRLLSYLPRALGMEPIAASVLAGLFISAFGALIGIISLYLLFEDKLGAEGATRSAFYFLIFPTSFFLLQVYTEGLFVAFTFSSLVLMKRKKYLASSIIAALAILTRAVGITLIIPLVVEVLKDVDWESYRAKKTKTWNIVRMGLPALFPMAVFIIWKISFWGKNFSIVERNVFGLSPFNLKNTIYYWKKYIGFVLEGNMQTFVFCFIEISIIILAIIACRYTLKKDTSISLYSFSALLISATSGQAIANSRYILTLPAVFLFLGLMGKKVVFDKAWTLASILLMGMLVTLFSFNMCVV